MSRSKFESKGRLEGCGSNRPSLSLSPSLLLLLPSYSCRFWLAVYSVFFLSNFFRQIVAAVSYPKVLPEVLC